jgi:hypothetical protein
VIFLLLRKASISRNRCPNEFITPRLAARIKDLENEGYALNEK